MSEGGTVHNELKSQAFKILIERGFTNSEIEYEYRVKIGRKNFIVDVAGLKDGTPHTAIECGGVSNKDKLIQLKTLFDVVEQIPYLDSAIIRQMNLYENQIRKQNRIISQLKQERQEPREESKEDPLHDESPIMDLDNSKVNPGKLLEDYKSMNRTLDKVLRTLGDEEFQKRMDEKLKVKKELERRIDSKMQCIEHDLSRLQRSSRNALKEVE